MRWRCHRRTGGRHFLGWDGVGQLVGQRPAADLGAIQLEGVQAQRLGGNEAVGARRRAGQPFGQEGQHGLGPRSSVVAAGAARLPGRAELAGAGAAISDGQGIEPAAGEAEFLGCRRRRERSLAKVGEHIADECRRMTVGELLVIFKGGQVTRQSCPHRHSFRRASLRSPSSKNGGGDRRFLLC